MGWRITGKRRLIIAVIVLLGYGQVWAEDWDSGHHDIFNGETYGEIGLFNDATADMWGGSVYELGTFDTSRFNMYDGTMNRILGRYNSIVNIYGGTIIDVGLAEDALVNIYSYDVIYHYTAGYNDRGWIEGKYIHNDQNFTFDFATYDNSHINIVPEPATFLLLGLGAIFIKKKH